MERNPGVPGSGVELDVEWCGVRLEADAGPTELGLAVCVVEGSVDGERELVAGLEVARIGKDVGFPDGKANGVTYGYVR